MTIKKRTVLLLGSLKTFRYRVYSKNGWHRGCFYLLKRIVPVAHKLQKILQGQRWQGCRDEKAANKRLGLKKFVKQLQYNV